MEALPTNALACLLKVSRVVWDVSGVRAGVGQYPGEKEITFPPYTCLESDGDARLERDAHGGEVIIFPLKVFPPLPFQVEVTC